MKVLLREMEELAGEELDEDRMRHVLENAYKAWELWDELWELKKMKPCPVPNMFNLVADGTRLSMWGTERGIEIMQAVVDACKERVEKGTYTAPEIARVYWSYIYYYTDFYELFNWFENRGISFLGQIISVMFQPEPDFSSRDSMIRMLSEVTFDYTMTRQMGGGIISEQWLGDIEGYIKELDAEAAIYCGYHACKHAAGSNAYFRRELTKRAKIPTLSLQGDCFDKRISAPSYWQEEIVDFLNSVVLKGGKKIGP
jgi:benzoyl-CoA reductase/2-hydroxyglutaryl-CoA dehydratase subunit BcrC/BadD/HgdB